MFGKGEVLPDSISVEKSGYKRLNIVHPWLENFPKQRLCKNSIHIISYFAVHFYYISVYIIQMNPSLYTIWIPTGLQNVKKHTSVKNILKKIIQVRVILMLTPVHTLGVVYLQFAFELIRHGTF